ncbi:hypothetical protein [Nocardia sp. CY41]|uniref:hypothetical protein n=1 Tax=Nocardia sp. CY41 TaxID=2608686 RepID=UPI0013579C16|nr:hypothetical protein [Nocardia sp. CY41]
MTDTTTGEELSLPAGAGSGTDRALRRVRILWMFAVLALFVGGVAAVPAWFQAYRFYRFDWVPVWALAVCWTAAVVLLAVPRLGRRRGRGRIALAAALGVAMVPVWSVSMFVASFVAEDSAVVAIEVSADGHHELVTESYKEYNNPAACRVLLRERGGLFSRQAYVWHDEVCPQHVSFTGATTISLTEPGSGKPKVTTFDADRMQVARIHRTYGIR